MKIVPLRVDDTTTIYVQVEETAVVSQPAAAEGQLEGAKEKIEDAIRTFDEIGATILAVCRSIHAKAYAAMGEAKPQAFEAEFGIKLGGEVAIPFVTKAQGDAEFKIKATWGS